jgi:hypothetical protein
MSTLKTIYTSGLMILTLFVLAGTVSAGTITTSPPNLGVVPGLNNSLNIVYMANEPDWFTPFSYTSTLGRFETPDSVLLGTVQTTVTIQMPTVSGTATERLVVPPRIIQAAMDRGISRFIYRRSFEAGVDIPSVDSVVILNLVPSSAAPFSIVRMELAFLKEDFSAFATQSPTRPTSGGRITVPRNSKLFARAEIAYNGSGILRGQWKVDGQILAFVTRYLYPGMRTATIDSPSVPSLPTYDTGLHRVEFEILQPEPGFEEPTIFYFVSVQPGEAAVGTLRLSGPPDRATIPLDTVNPPEFSWVAPGGAEPIYHFALYPQAVPGMVDRSDGADGAEPAIRARTDQTSYALSPFDLEKLSPVAPYVWQVEGFVEGRRVFASPFRTVFFTRPETPSPGGLNYPLGPQMPN